MTVQQPGSGQLLHGVLEAVARREVLGRVGQLAHQLVEGQLDRVQIDVAVDDSSLHRIGVQADGSRGRSAWHVLGHWRILSLLGSPDAGAR